MSPNQKKKIPPPPILWYLKFSEFFFNSQIYNGKKSTIFSIFHRKPIFLGRTNIDPAPQLVLFFSIL